MVCGVGCRESGVGEGRVTGFCDTRHSIPEIRHSQESLFHTPHPTPHSPHPTPSALPNPVPKSLELSGDAREVIALDLDLAVARCAAGAASFLQ